jgi:hypothetical protein
VYQHAPVDINKTRPAAAAAPRLSLASGLPSSRPALASTRPALVCVSSQSLRARARLLPATTVAVYIQASTRHLQSALPLRHTKDIRVSSGWRWLVARCSSNANLGLRNSSGWRPSYSGRQHYMQLTSRLQRAVRASTGPSPLPPPRTRRLSLAYFLAPDCCAVLPAPLFFSLVPLRRLVLWCSPPASLPLDQTKPSTSNFGPFPAFPRRLASPRPRSPSHRRFPSIS